MTFITAGATRERTMAEGAKFDAQATSEFAQASHLMTRWDIEAGRQAELHGEIDRSVASQETPGGLPSAARRLANLQDELADCRAAMDGLDNAARSARRRGRTALGAANTAWEQVAAFGSDTMAVRRSVPVPRIFSVEVLGVGFGESFILHYGDPDDPRFILIDGGEPRIYEQTLKPRLEVLKARWAPHGALAIEYVIVSNQDNDRTGGLERMFQELAKNNARGDQPSLEIKNVWYDSFALALPNWQKSALRGLVEYLGIPLNKPFDHLVMRPERGRITIDLGNGLKATILNPDARSLADLHRSWCKQADQRTASPPEMPKERFSTISISYPPPHPVSWADSGCTDRTVPNRASIVILFEFESGGWNEGDRVLRFLHTGDSCSNQIEEGLRLAGMSTPEGRFAVDLLLVPHLGSRRNVSPEFLGRVKADQYLFTGNRKFGPNEATLQLILDARRDDAQGRPRYTFQFVNRDGAGGLGERLDAFFAVHDSKEYGYRRVFRSSAKTAVMIDLLERVRY
jgi:beta-lactamase superfamily II metal-dependent hydrolase